MGEISQGPVADLAVDAEGFAEEDGGRGVAVGDGGHVHAYILWLLISYYKHNNCTLHAYIICAQWTLPHENKRFQRFKLRNFGLARTRPQQSGMSKRDQRGSKAAVLGEATGNKTSQRFSGETGWKRLRG